MDHRTLRRDESIKMMITYSGAGLTDAHNKVFDTINAHSIFKFLEDLYKDHLHMVVDVEGDDMQVEWHR